MYNPFGTKETRYGDIKTDSHRANTKVEDSGNLLNEGKRFRQLEYGIFLTPDPLEYVDGYNPYIYCGQNPWGKWDPLGLSVYMMYYTGKENGLFAAAARTRQQIIEGSKGFNREKDIVILQNIKDISSIKEMTEANVAKYSKQYGQTAEVGIWSHSGKKDGPVGTEPTSRHAVDEYQMDMKGWAEIAYNWGQDAKMNIYGCDSGNDSTTEGSFAKRLSTQENMKDVEVSGQTSTAVPSEKVDSREGASLFGTYSGETYVISGDRDAAFKSYLGLNKNAHPMNVYKNGEKIKSEYQESKKED